MTESIEKVIKRLQKFNCNYFNNHLYNCEIMEFENLSDFCEIYWLNNNEVLTINKDGTQVSEFDSFDRFTSYLWNTVNDGFVVDITERNIYLTFKGDLKNDTIWFSNFKIDKIIMKYVMCYIVANDLLGDASIDSLKSIKIPIINFNDQEILARKFGKQYKVIKYLKRQVKLEQERIKLEQENSQQWQIMLRKL